VDKEKINENSQNISDVQLEKKKNKRQNKNKEKKYQEYYNSVYYIVTIEDIKGTIVIYKNNF